jgi:hypothetical protein
MWLSQIWSELTGRKLKVRLVVDSMGSMKNVLTTKLPVEKRLRNDLACIRQGLRNGDFEISWVPSRANLSNPLTKESESDTARLKPCTHLKRPLLDALRSNCTNFRGIRLVPKTQADVSKY